MTMNADPMVPVLCALLLTLVVKVTMRRRHHRRTPPDMSPSWIVEQRRKEALTQQLNK